MPAKKRAHNNNVPVRRRRTRDPNLDEAVARIIEEFNRRHHRDSTPRDARLRRVVRDAEDQVLMDFLADLSDLDDEYWDEPEPATPLHVSPEHARQRLEREDDDDEDVQFFPPVPAAFDLSDPSSPGSPQPAAPPGQDPGGDPKRNLFVDLYNALRTVGAIYESNGTWYISPMNYLSAIFQLPNPIPPMYQAMHDLYQLYAKTDGTLLCKLDRDSRGDEYMEIPFNSVYNLKVTLFLYILDLLVANFDKGYIHFEFWTDRFFSERVHPTTQSSSPRYVDSTIINTARPELESVLLLYSNICDYFNKVERTYRDEDGLSTWTENDLESGDRICFTGWDLLVAQPASNQALNDCRLYFHLKAIPAVMGFGGAMFDASTKRVVEALFDASSGIKVVTNDTDYFCFLYTFLLGLIHLFYHRCLTKNSLYESVQHVMAVACSQCTPWIKEFAENIHPGTTLTDMIQDELEKKYSLKDFATLMKSFEDLCLAPTTAGEPPDAAIDVYIMDADRRVYPAYASARPSPNRIRMLVISRPICSHFALITNPKDLWKRLNGKVFYTCTKCNQSFFSKALMISHVCGQDRDTLHWCEKVAEKDPNSDDVVCGVCWKCRLKFNSDRAFEFHKENCFMKGRNGFRIVTFPDEDFLCGEVEKRVQLPSIHVCFADFECFIDEEGEHHFMSGGLYNEMTGIFDIYYTLEDFMNAVIQLASKTKKLIVYFHNAMNYDANFILKYVLQKEAYKDWSIQCIMKSSNRLQKLSFMFQEGTTKHILEIGDTFHFFTMSLDRICSSLKKSTVEENKKVFPRFFTEFGTRYLVDESEVNMILKKNLFPYRFFNCSEVLDTPIDEFRKIFEPQAENLKYFSENVTVGDLRENIDDFNAVVSKFGCGTARDYHDVYLMCDVLQIADVFMAARESLWNTHTIDISEFMGMPSASWSAFLHFNPDLKIPLYQHTMFAEFFARMTRGGVTSAPLRRAASDENHAILYLDVNGLYPFVMREYAYPCGRFYWWDVTEEENEDPMNFIKLQIDRVRSKGMGFCACVDLHYTREVKDAPDQFPFAPDHMLINDQYYDEKGEMYPFLKKWSEANDGARMKPFKGLVGTLYDKERYCVHWRLLEWYMQHGLIVTKVHHMVTFSEDKYLEGYVSHNINLRNERTDELGKMLYKLMGNSIYGKTFENPFNHYKYVIVRNKLALQGLIQTADVASITPIDENNSVVKLTGDTVELNKPTYIGACVTEYAKLHMYQLFYDKIGKLFPKVELVYTDTDSFIIRVETPLKGQALIDYLNSQEKLIGKEGGLIKSETGTDLIREVIALRSKVYAYVTESGKIGKRAKGTTTAAQERDLSWEKYVEALLTLRAIPTNNMQFLRSGFGVTSVTLEKVSLSANDGKRQVEEDGIHTHAFGF